MGGDHLRLRINNLLSSFNPRPRMGGDTLRPCTRSAWRVFQSTPPHGGRREMMDSETFFFGVSIHAPAWGATSSTPRSSRKATGFNPRPRMGGDWYFAVTAYNADAVSIHAPAWGATVIRHQNSTVLLVSIHAPAWGATVVLRNLKKDICMFQSTPPHGGRHRDR